MQSGILRVGVQGEACNDEMNIDRRARLGVDYCTKNEVFPIDGSVTLEGLKANIEFNGQAQRELGL